MLKISAYLYLKGIIPKYESYKLNIHNKWVNFNNISNLLIAIDNSLSKKKGNLYNFFLNLLAGIIILFKNFLAKIQIYSFNKLSKKRDLYILSTNRSYFMPKVYSYLKQKIKI